MKTQEHGVVLLATDKPNKNHTLWLNSNKQLLFTKTSKPESLIPQHLYITSDEEIREGDYVINMSSTNKNDWYIFKVEKDDEIQFNPIFQGSKAIQKIIATTDTSLINKRATGEQYPDWEYDVPQIPQEYIQYFVEQYNKGVMLEKCEVEYVKIYKQNGSSLEQDVTDRGITMTMWERGKTYEKPKLNPDNTINIVIPRNIITVDLAAIPEDIDVDKYIELIRNDSIQIISKEKMYSREEVENKLKALSELHELKASIDMCNETGTKPNYTKDEEELVKKYTTNYEIDIDKWIKENLK